MEVKVGGMDCPDCATKIVSGISRLPGIRHVEVSVLERKMVIEGENPKKEIDLDRVEKELKRLGFYMEQDVAIAVLRCSVQELCCKDEAETIEAIIKRLPGIEDVSCDLMMKQVTIRFHAEKVSEETIKASLKRAGFLPIEQKEPSVSFGLKFYGWMPTLVSGIFFLAGLMGSGIASIVFYVVAIMAGGFPMARKGALAVRVMVLDMNALMSLAVIGAVIIGEYAEGASVVFLFSLAELLESYSVDRARKAIRSVLNISPTQACIRRDHQEMNVGVESVMPGDVVVVRPGERIPLDGEVIEGSSSVNQAPLTGESMPIHKGLGDRVYAGSINEHGALWVSVTRLYQDTTLARMIHMVEEAQARRAPAQRFVDRFARIYTPSVIFIALLLTIFVPMLSQQPFVVWFYRALVLLVIACPCALVISTPVSIASGLTQAARNGVLVKGGAYLEMIGKIKAIFFDKTGTLTFGMPKVVDVIPLQGHSVEEVVQIAALVEDASTHPLALAILTYAKQIGIRPLTASNFRSIPGKGAEAHIHGTTYLIGNHRLFEERKLCDSKTDETLKNFEREGKTAILIGSNETLIGIMTFMDQIRKTTPDVLSELKTLGIERTIMLTGDNQETAQTIAKQAGVDEFRAELLPEDKVEAVETFKQNGAYIAMVGDGVNDAPALACADVGIAMGKIGTDTAMETADMVLISDDLTRLPFILHLSRKTLRIIHQNIAFSLIVKLLFLALAIPGWATLWMAIIADMGASLLVIANSLRILIPNHHRFLRRI